MKKLIMLTQQIGQLLKSKNLMLATAESCTGGEVAQIITSVPGSSGWFERGFVTYSNAAKTEMLGVKPTTITNYGAVSEQTAREMAEGALHHSHADVSLAITGIAGPGGGTVDKPVGTVWLAWAGKKFPTETECKFFSGDRLAVRDAAAQFGLQRLIKIL